MSELKQREAASRRALTLFRPLSRRRCASLFRSAALAARNHLDRFQAQLASAARVRRPLIRALHVEKLMPDVGVCQGQLQPGGRVLAVAVAAAEGEGEGEGEDRGQVSFCSWGWRTRFTCAP